jgi:probable biosynthetic protein (TIGR04098 family)
MPYTYDLTLGLPHTNYRQLSEHLLLKHAGHFQWQAIADAAGMPLSVLRTMQGGEVYASFYYIEERIPASAPLEAFHLDDTVRFIINLRSYKNIAIEGRIVFGHPDDLNDPARTEKAAAVESDDRDLPFIHFANIFITPEKGNSRLRVAPPAQADFSNLPSLPNEENPYHITRAASETRSLGLLTGDWIDQGSHVHEYAIDVDRDTNGAGLVYFANYIAFMDSAERAALEGSPIDEYHRPQTPHRSLRHRRIAYYGNADVYDTLRIRVTIFRSASQPELIGFQYVIERQEDDQMICLSEAVKTLSSSAT